MASREDLDLRQKIKSLTENLLDCYEELDLIHRISTRILSTADVQQQLRSILQEAIEILEADLGWLYLVNNLGQGETCICENVNIDSARLLNDRVVVPLISVGKSKAFYNLREEEEEIPPDAPDAFLCAVLKTEKDIYGALCIGRNGADGFFTSGDMKLTHVLSTFSSLALENFNMYREKLAEEQARIQIQQEVRLAAQIQKELLPDKTPVIDGYELAGKSLPARVVGGDYYDFIDLDENRLALCLADVSGKGLPASLLMSNLQATIRGQALLQASVDQSLFRSNLLLCHSTTSEKFVTLFLAHLDHKQHHLCYSNAGHNPPILLEVSGQVRELKTGGLILGFLEDPVYQSETIPMEPGDLLLIYSDGITEARNGIEEEFGSNRLIDILKAHSDLPCEQLLNIIIDEVEQFSGGVEQADDMTLTALRRMA